MLHTADGTCMLRTVHHAGWAGRNLRGCQGGANAHEDVAGLLIAVPRVLPGLRQQPVVPVDVVRVEPELALFDVLLNRRPLLVLRAARTRQSACQRLSPACAEETCGVVAACRALQRQLYGTTPLSNADAGHHGLDETLIPRLTLLILTLRRTSGAVRRFSRLPRRHSFSCATRQPHTFGSRELRNP